MSSPVPVVRRQHDRNEAINIAVIGCGHWGPNHVRTFSTMPGARLLAVVDRDPEKLDRISRAHPTVALETDLQRVLDDERIHAVVVATPTSTHFPIVRQALLAKKHVLCEKPLCQSAEQARELVEIAERNGLVLMTGHIFLFNPGIVKVKELLDSGEIGTPFYLSAVRTNLGLIQSDVNVVYDLATHDISVFNWWLDAIPESVSATGGAFLRTDFEELAFVSLRYPGGVVGAIHVSWLSPKKVRQITVVGSSKMATWDDHELSSPVSIYEKGAKVQQEYGDYGEFLRISMWDGDVRLPKVVSEEPLRRQDAHFLEAIGTGRLDRSDGKFAIGVLNVLEAIDNLLKRGGIPVKVEQ